MTEKATLLCAFSMRKGVKKVWQKYTFKKSMAKIYTFLTPFNILKRQFSNNIIYLYNILECQIPVIRNGR